MKIAFVDDERLVLDGLRRMLHPMRKQWEMEFFDGAEDALAGLGQTTFDVVVSDMRMPGMNGAELLERVRRDYPHMVRIVLSGHCDEEMILKSVGPAHQYLAKPCDAHTLRTTIARAADLRALMHSENLQRVVSQIAAIPSLPSVYMELVHEIESPEARVERITEIVSQDVGMVAKLLQLVNSAFFGLRHSVASVQQAVAMVGLRALKALVLSIQVFDQLSDDRIRGLDVEALMAHSVSVGLGAQNIARCEGHSLEMQGIAFQAGMLHDLGKLVLASSNPGVYASVDEAAERSGTHLWEAELEAFGTTHGEVGGYLLGIWGIPDPIVEALVFHHDPSACVHREFSPLTAVHTSNALAHLGDVHQGYDGRMKVDRSYIEAIGLTERLPHWRAVCANPQQENGEG